MWDGYFGLCHYHPPHPSPLTPTTHSHPHNLLPSVPSSCHSLPLSIYNFLLAQTVGVTGGYFLTQGSMSGFNTMCQADSGDVSSGAAARRTRRKALSAVVCIDASQKSVNLSDKQYVCCKGNTSWANFLLWRRLLWVGRWMFSGIRTTTNCTESQRGNTVQLLWSMAIKRIRKWVSFSVAESNCCAFNHSIINK